jgi:molybdenum cofactor cytidylyltransferase
MYLMGKIRSIILAAGESRRMGFPKMLLQINGKTMIENVIGNVAGSGTIDILVVLGAGREKLTELVMKYDIKYCFNENYSQGMLSSVQCGFRNLPQDTDAVLVFQGDQPFISSQVIDSIIGAYRSTGKGIVMPVFKGKRGHPLLLDIKYRAQIEKLDPNLGLRSIAYLYSDDVLEVETDDPGVLRDFNTYDDYRNDLKQT